jgi:hypothetical protein
MSKVQLQGNASGTGVFTIASPNSNTDRTLTLPDQTGTLLSSSAQGIPKSALPTGSVLQVVNATTDIETSNLSTSVWADTTLTASITPTSSSSKILILLSQNGVNRQTNPGGVRVRLLRGATILSEYAGIYGAAWQGAGIGSENGVGSVSAGILDSPGTASSVTYKSQLIAGQGGQAIVQHGNAVSTLILMEIAA